MHKRPRNFKNRPLFEDKPDELKEAFLKARQAKKFEHGGKTFYVHDVSVLPGIKNLPRALVELIENCIRCVSDEDEALSYVRRILDAGLNTQVGEEISFMPARVLFQDFTGVPVFVDFAAMRDAFAEQKGDPRTINPQIPCTLVVDHSVIADVSGISSAARKNRELEAQRNKERFAFLKWAANSFDNVRIVPPGKGICHQLNMEYISEVVCEDALSKKDHPLLCFDTLVGTDSHTTTVNGLGVMGWGTGGIEAEAAALGQPVSMLVPSVVGLYLKGQLSDGISGMDLALSVCERLRTEGVVASLVEVFGEGTKSLSATQRACVANMTPEYGATTTLFPVDEQTLDYLELTGRSKEQIDVIRSYLEMQTVFGIDDAHTERRYERIITIDLSDIKMCLAGPSRPHRRVELADLPERFESEAHLKKLDLSQTFELLHAGRSYVLRHGSIALAAITSCTTATDPAMMVAAGICAKKARAFGLRPLPWVKKVFAPGSHAAAELLKKSGLLRPLEDLGFNLCGFGCMSCIGNSGPLPQAVHELASDVEFAAVLSGNRNFDGRISPDVSQSYLADPALVVAYSLAGTVDIDLTSRPVGVGSDGRNVMLKDILPSTGEIEAVLQKHLSSDIFTQTAEHLLEGYSEWEHIFETPSATFEWDPDSTYVRKPPYFEKDTACDLIDISHARPLALLGDFVTTDHISPAGSIAPDSPAALYLHKHSTEEKDFNTYGSRRGNHEVMMRGTFANTKLSNLLAKERQGGWTYDYVRKQYLSIFDAATNYANDQTPLILIAGKMYGSGSSRDWAAKGPALLGVKAVIAQSFERIHRSNLVQMGIIPLQFEDEQSAESLGLDGSELYDIDPIDLSEKSQVQRRLNVKATHPDGTSTAFSVKLRVDTPTEAAYIAAGGILPYVLKQLA